MPVCTLVLKNKNLNFAFESGVCVLSLLNSAAIQVSSACAGQGYCSLCRIKILQGQVSELTCIEQNLLSHQQIQQGTRLACQIKALSDIRVVIENPINVLKWKKLSPLNKTAINGRDHYGIAFDLGTTHLRLSLWNISQQQRVIAWSAFNPQFRFGADVLTRLLAAHNSEADALEQHSLIKQALKNAFNIIAKLPLNPAQIETLLIVGNTAMLTLISLKNFQLLLEPDYWTQTIHCELADVNDWQTSLNLIAQTPIEIVQPLGGFIGSDLLAGILATGLTHDTEPALLIDFGTNSELALWDGKTLWISSVPGGPAFEGSGISCGIPAGVGAIYHLRLNANGYWDAQVFGKTAATGLCGSALVDVIAQLVTSGHLNRNGRFKNTANSEFLVALSPTQTFALKKHDIDIFQRAKAATGVAQMQLCKAAGLAMQDLARVCVCGAFGEFLNIQNAQTIGLLPNIATEKIHLYENTALKGCELLLAAAEVSQWVEDIKSRTQMVNMAYSLGFDDCFVENLYLQPLAFSP